MPDDLYTTKRRQFAQGYQEALRDVVNAAIENAGDSAAAAMLEWIRNNADNDATRERAARVTVWADAETGV